MVDHEERDARVGDYLDDKLQTPTDLESLDALLSSVRNQHVLLKKQLEDAEQDQKDAEQASKEQTLSLRRAAQQFTKNQKDIDRRIRIITQSDTSDDAVHRFEASMDRLRRLDIADGYIQQLKVVDSLAEQCTSNLGKSDVAALDAYSQLHDLSSKLPELQGAAEGAAPHFTDYIMRQTKELHRQIEKAFASQLESVLKKMHWPTPGITVPMSLVQNFREAVGKLLNLQKPELDSKESAPMHSRGQPLVLLPLQVMVRPLELAFQYHFGGDRPTNRLDKPEYFFSHITDKLLNQYADFMADNLQPILLDEFRGTKMALNAAYIDATSAFITSLLPMVRTKIFSTLPKVSREPQLLSHLMHEVMSFDATIGDDWHYDAGNGDDGWQGLSYEVLSMEDWFQTWLNVEKDFALARYLEIIEAADNFDLDYDSFGLGTTKPTKAAIRVNDLLETITDHYRTLSSFSHRLRFLIDIQLDIFDRFHERLHEGLLSYQSRVSTIGRTSREEQAELQGVKGLESLCKVYGSAEYLEKAMRDWSDDVFFLGMWMELQKRAARPAELLSPTTGASRSVQQLTQSTTTALGPNSGEDADAEGALFDETAGSYQRLRIKCETILSELVNNNIRSTLTAYTRIKPWSSLQSSSTATASSATSTQQVTPLIPPTAELDSLLSLLSSHFSFLSKALGKVPLRKIARSAAATIDTILFDQVLLRHSFSAAGAAQFSADISSILAIMAQYVGAGVAEYGLKRVSEGCSLVGLPIRGSRDGDGEGGSGGDAKDAGRLGLWDVEKRMFEGSGEEAWGCLVELGLERLSVAEGRKVLARRIELSS